MIIIIVTIEDSNAFGFNKRNFGIRSGFKKKAHNFSYSVKWNIFSKFQFNTLNMQKTFCVTSIF